MPLALSNEHVTERLPTNPPIRRIPRTEKVRAAEPEASPVADRGLPLQKRGVLRHSPWDALFVALAIGHSAMLLAFPSIQLIALGQWWNANTISHNFIHLPFFRSRSLNAAFSAFESLVLGIPQRLWRDRHLAHHAGMPWRRRWSRQLALETFLVLAMWGVLLAFSPRFFATVYLPGWLLSLGLCQFQGFFEHARGTASHYGRLYNLLFFNDGYHVEHHTRPAEHWTRLPKRRPAEATGSRWPAVLRWLEHFNLDGMERLVLRSQPLQRFVLRKHERAFRALLPGLGNVRRVEIVGGGMFPRTALILQRLLPEARLTIIDASLENLRSARFFVNHKVEFVHDYFDASLPAGVDLVVIPLAFIGDRAGIYRQPPARTVLVHDWLWHRRGTGVIISWSLLKRLNLIRQ
ncbi:MAG: hypothetical protein DME18_08495 [Verrucomicrobia bacterium]|nr:MAG: hypothetical protein DME18_08495 [Verrucomicrobiota bacterium]